MRDGLQRQLVQLLFREFDWFRNLSINLKRSWEIIINIRGLIYISFLKKLLILQENGDLKYSDMKIRRWDKSLEKPQLDYSEFFMEDVGQVMCLWQ